MNDRDQPLTVGTAGHIDHGKSALVKALTSARTDRLPEERQRGMTIALGYARLRLPSGRELSLIDVPGHERLVRVMIAGATGIDLFLLVVAADDGVMPQTSEHLRVLRALAVHDGVVAVTKTDLADPARAIGEVEQQLPGAPVVACSIRTGEGVAAVGAALENVAKGLRSRAHGGGGGVLHVDRVFSIRGAGTVVTGTLWSGSIATGQRLKLLEAERVVRVRGVQVHDRPVVEARAGQRVAVNVTGVRRDEVRRGDALTTLDAPVTASYRFDAELRVSLADPLERVHVHHGTRESVARLVHLGGPHWQVRLQQPLLVAAGDHVVIRRISVPDTIGGGIVLDPLAPKHATFRALGRRLDPTQTPPAPATTPDRPLAAKRSPSPALQSQQNVSRPLSPPARALEARLRDAGVRPPSDMELGAEREHLAELRQAGRAVRVGRSMYAHVDALQQVREAVEAIVKDEGHVTLARLRDELHISRRYAQALLEHLDSTRVTLRLGDDRRILRRTGRTSTSRVTGT